MIVADLRKHLSDMASFLDRVEGGKAANGIRAVDRGLEPYSQYKFEDFAAFLGLATQIADEFKRTGQVPVPPPKKAPAPKKQPASDGQPTTPKPALAETKVKVRELYDAAGKPGFAPQQLDELDALEKSFTKAEWKEMAATVSAAGKLKSNANKPDIINAIKQSIRLRWTDNQRSGQ